MAEKQRIGIIGKGNVGSALEKGLDKAGHEVRIVGRDPDRVQQIADWAQVLVLAVPFPERENAMKEMGNGVQGKVLIDATNALTPEYGFAADLEKGGAGQLQENHPNVKVVKAFNTVFAKHMPDGQASGETLSLFVAGDDEQARRTVLDLGTQLGFDPLDAGPLENAVWLETLGFLNITLGYKVGLGTECGFRYVHPKATAQQREAVPRQV